MKIALITLLLGVCTLTFALPQTKTVMDVVNGKVKIADKIFLQNQLNLLRLLRHVHQPNQFLDQVQLAKTLDIESDITTLFINPTAVKDFIKLYRVGLLPRKEIFSVLNEVHRRQVIALFHVFYYAKDFDTFYKSACWARDHVNEGMFVYALTVAVLHRQDCQGIVLPAPYEIYPHLFINRDVIKKAREYKMQNFALFKPEILKRVLKDELITEKLKTKWGKTNYLKTMLNEENWDETRHFMPSHMDMMKDDLLHTMKRTNRLDVTTLDRTVLDDTVLDRMDSTELVNLLKETGKPYTTVSHMNTLTSGTLGKTVDDLKVVIIPTNYTGWYLNVDRDQKLSYFMEDIGLNSYYHYFHTDYPFWMDGVQFGLNKDRRGELYFYLHQQLLARFYLERLSNGLGEIELVNVRKPVTTGFVCNLEYENGMPFPMRPKHTELIRDDFTLLTAERLELLEKRILNAIDSGFVITETGEKINLYTENGINILGNVIEGNMDSVNRRFYGYLHIYAKMLLGLSTKSIDQLTVRPSALELHTTALRDPVFYSIYKKIVHYFLYYKNNLPSYKYTNLILPGVKVEDIVVDKLITYFDFFDVELNNALYTDFTVENKPSVLVKARQMRLNHLPFTTRINVLSDKLTKVVVRLFLGPKHDENGQILDINVNRVNFVEIDKFIHELKVGKNVIERSSRLARHTVVDRTSYFNLYRKVMLALEGTEEFLLDNTEAHCGFPNRLLLPKGKKGGMVYQLFVMITPFQGVTEDRMTMTDEKIVTCRIGCGDRFIDNLPMGYPLDRKIDMTQFFVPNMHFKDVTIYHKRMEDIIDTKTVDARMDKMIIHDI